MFSSFLLLGVTLLSADYRTINEAIDACAAQGGGTVVVAAGRHAQKGPVRFRSNVELHLEDGAELVFSQDPSDYLPAVFTSWEGIECWNYSPLVYAFACTNVAVTGSGSATFRAFEGEYDDSTWRRWAKRLDLARVARRRLYDWGATDCPTDKRRISDLPDSCTRPQFFQFNRCRDVRLEGFRIRESPFWTIHLYLCTGVIVRGLDVVARHHNNDGIDIEMTKDVLIERCSFDQGDDTFVIKSGRNRDGWRLNTPTENVEIRDCHMRRAKSFFTIGSEISGGVRNVRLHDCSVGEAGRICHIKTNARRGGFVEGVRMENVRAGKVDAAFAIKTDVLYEWATFPDYELRTTRIGDIALKDVVCNEAIERIDVQGDLKLPVKGIRLENVVVRRALAPDRFVNATDVSENGRPVVASQVFPIVAFGAKPDGSSSTAAIRKAIDAAAQAGGGRVTVPAGVWATGPIELKDGVELNLDPAAILRFTDDPKAYELPSGGYRPLVSAEGVARARLSGYGRFEARTDGWAAVPKADRPPFCRFRGCRTTVVEGCAFRNSPSRVIEARSCDGFLLMHVEFIAQIAEDEFLDIDSADATVFGCSFRIGDGRLDVLDPSHRLVHPVR